MSDRTANCFGVRKLASPFVFFVSAKFHNLADSYAVGSGDPTGT
jgi:hypothetical protein